MGKKSEKRWESRVSATQASRTFSELLDQVDKGQRFTVHRRGRDICVMLPPPVGGRRASECLEMLRGRPSALLDDAFGQDLLQILAEAQADERPSWD